MILPFASIALALVQALPAQSKAQTLIERLQLQLDSRDAAELALLALDLSAEDLERGNVREAFAVLGPAIYHEQRCLDAGLTEPEPARVLLAALEESFGVALTHLGEFELAMAAFSFAEDETAKLLDRRTPHFPPASPVRDAQQQQGYLAIRRAAAMRSAGDPQRAWTALEDLRKAGKVEGLDREGTGFFFSQRGNALEDLGRFSEAIDDYARARSAWKELGDRKRELYELKTAGDALRRMGNPQEALRRYEEALKLAEGLSFSPLELHENYAGLALVLMDLGRHEDALNHLERSLRELEAFHESLAGAESVATRARSFATVATALGAWARIRFELDGQTMARASLSQIDRWRGLGLSHATVARKDPNAVAANLENERSRLRREMQIHSGDPAAREGLRRTLSQIDLRLMGAKLPRSAAPEKTKPAKTGPAEMGDRKMPAGGVLLEYFVGPEDVFLWSLDASGYHWFSLAKGRAETELFLRSIETLCTAVSKRADAVNQGGEAVELSRKLLPDDLRERLAAARFLWVVPDAEIRQVPWAAVGGAGILPRIPVSVLPSADFGFRMSASVEPKPGAAIFAAPASQVEGFAPLLFSESEGRTIAAHFPGARLHLAAQASEDALTAETRLPGALLHISSHGIFSRTLQNGSALLLAPGTKEDGWLWAAEAEALSFPGRLVVLSSCHSGEGEWIPGESVGGLSRAFLVGGARAVIGSLWAVDQEPTTLFMEEFYRRLARGESAGDALALAPQALQGGKYAGERFWAGFQLYGDLNWRLPAEMISRDGAPAVQPPESGGRLRAVDYWFWALLGGALVFLFLLTRRTGR